MSNIRWLGDNSWITTFKKNTEFWDSVTSYIDLCNGVASDRWFRIIPYPTYHETQTDDTTTLPIWNWKHIVFTIELWKLNVKWIIEWNQDTLLDVNML
jgi:hypothetical protein